MGEIARNRSAAAAGKLSYPLRPVILRLTVLFVIDPALVLQDTSGFVGNIPATIDLNMAPKGAFIFGRGTPHWKADVTINATRDGKDIISRRHAQIDRRANKFVITDLVNSCASLLRLLNTTAFAELGQWDICQLYTDSKACIEGW